MRAIVATRFGGADVLELTELPDPEPGPGELLIEVAAAGVLWLDVQVRQGNGPEFVDAKPPYVPGGAVAGVISAVGDGVDSSRIGERVLGRPAAGGYAERAVVTEAVAVPDELDLRPATALIDDGTTAVALLDRTPVRPGEWVLVQPALGGLGSLLVQLATAKGARVIAAARGEHKLAAAKELGAAEAVDYGDPQWTDRVRELTGGVDVVFDGVGGELGAQAARLVADGGRFSSYGMAGGAPTTTPNGVGMEQLSTFWPDLTKNLNSALAAAAAGTLRPVIGTTYPLAEAASAHRDIELRRNVGKVLLTM
ncbi:zinc-binding dehydrogenase [Labedaea rhizosphaerae]|uniref:NADPH:quinone reductase-like Zn-dependent oxidoreductase n=1 Tax=Labedaea rhizosphaerae TaxID=598644 RepID=A0A4V3D026_LABRH|nr:zinc-binding dehydrogenase [Labedaea rhizosphaerae]TDQ04115.1 NADPH:quinone reductase-like Zn-dependent oxidoreductase [Labedaea rhizosphaerae]